MFKIEYKLSENDYLLFNEYQLLNSTSGKKSIIRARVLLLMMCLLAILFLAMFKLLIKYFPWGYIVLLSILSILWLVFSILRLVFFKKLLVASMKRNIKKLAKDGKLPYSKEGVLVFDEDFISDINSATESKTRYSCIEKCCITEHAIYLYFSVTQAFIISISAFSTEENKQEFIKFINSKI